MSFRKAVLRALDKLFDIPLQGDLSSFHNSQDIQFSCVINFYGRTHLLRNILASLAEQDFPKHELEVLLVEDRNGTEEGRLAADTFGKTLNIRYIPLDKNFGKMGYARNFAISHAKGKYALLLDDDTVILQKDFITRACEILEESAADVLVPHGFASHSILKGRYQFHDPYYPTSRCVVYRRAVFEELGGFVSSIVGQEDVEFVIRMNIADKKILNCHELEYLHPPLIVDNLRKSTAVGASFASLRGRYPFLVWMLLLINGIRHLPLLPLWFNKRFVMQGRFSLGFLLGIVYYALGKKTEYS